GRILEIRVHHHDGLPFRVVDPGRDGDLVAEVATEADYPVTGFEGGELSKQAMGRVDGAVVHEHDLPGLSQGAEELAQTSVERGGRLFFVEDGDHEGQSRTLGHG